MKSDPDSNWFHSIPVVGLIGGIGSGKSTIARWVSARMNVLLIDADDLGHQALCDDAVKTSLRARFGTEIFDERGSVRRDLLARRVFGDDEKRRTDRKELEDIVHPAIERRVIAAIRDAESRNHAMAVLLDAAVLLEAGWQHHCDAVVYVDAPEDLRWKRVQARNGWTLEEFRRRESSQLSLNEKKRRSDAVISNATDDDHGGQELLEFLCSRWSGCCKPPPNSSQR